MDPENENGEQQQDSVNTAAVMVDLAEPDNAKAITPVTAEAGDKAGNDDQQDEGRGTRRGREEANDDDADEFRSTGRKDFDKRLKREMRAKVQARSESAAISQENAQLREENERLRRGQQQRDETPNTADIDAKLTTKEAELEKAIEDGDSKAQARLHTEIASLTSEKSTRLAAPRRKQQDEPAPRREQQRQSGPTPTGRAFIDANQDWWTDPDHAAEKAAVIALDTELIRDGSNPNTEAHYRKLAARVKEKGLKVKVRQPYDDGEGDDDVGTEVEEREERERRTPPHGGNGNGRGRVNTELRDARAGKVTLQLGSNFDGPDAKTMREFKLDPANPAHQRAFAQSRRDRVLEENR